MKYVSWAWSVPSLHLLAFCSLAILDPSVGHTTDVLSPFIPVAYHSDLTLPRRVLSTSWCPSTPCVVFLACAPGIVPSIISFSRQLPCFLMVWPQYASFLALTVSNSSRFTPEPTHLFFFCAFCPVPSLFCCRGNHYYYWDNDKKYQDNYTLLHYFLNFIPINK